MLLLQKSILQQVNIGKTNNIVLNMLLLKTDTVNKKQLTTTQS
jgi:hypothetical protein